MPRPLPGIVWCRRLACTPGSAARRGFTRTDLLMILAVVSVLTVIFLTARERSASKARLTRCMANLQQVNRAVLQYAADHGHRLPLLDPSPAPGQIMFL